MLRLQMENTLCRFVSVQFGVFVNSLDWKWLECLVQRHLYVVVTGSVWCWCKNVCHRCSKKRFNILPPLVFSPTPPDPPPTSCRVLWRLCLSWAAAWLASRVEATLLSCPSLWWTSRWDSTWIWPCCRVTYSQRSCDKLVLHPRLVFLVFFNV